MSLFPTKASFFALMTLLGVMIGAGIFGLPFVVARAGVIPGLFYFLILGGAILLLHLFFGEIVLRTQGKHRLIGYAQRYLGKQGKILITCSTILGISGTLLAYVILGGDFLKIIFSSLVDWPSFYWALIFWFVCIFFLIFGIKLISRVEVVSNLIFFLTIFLLLCFSLTKFDFQNFSLINLEHIFLPYGVILFAFAGWTGIPEIGEILKTSQERKNYKKVITSGSIIVMVFYILFSLVLVGVSGRDTSSQVFEGLIPFLGRKIIFFGALAGAITLTDSFLVLGLYLTNTMVHDFKFQRSLALVFSCGLPLILFLIGLRSFIEVIGVVGVIIGAIEGVVIILIFKKAKDLGDRDPEYSLKVPGFLLYFLMGIFLLGAVIQFFYFS